MKPFQTVFINNYNEQWLSIAPTSEYLLFRHYDKAKIYQNTTIIIYVTDVKDILTDEKFFILIQIPVDQRPSPKVKGDGSDFPESSAFVFVLKRTCSLLC